MERTNEITLIFDSLPVNEHWRGSQLHPSAHS